MLLVTAILFALHPSFTCARAADATPRQVFDRAWELVKQKYYDPTFNGQSWDALKQTCGAQIATADDAHKSIQDLLGRLDNPSTVFLDQKAFASRPVNASAKIVGIGINLQRTKDGSKLLVTRTIQGGPAELAGIEAGDEMIQMDGHESKGMSPEHARIR